MKRFFTLIVLLVLSFEFLTAQESFIEHTIVKGESIYSISKKYGVTMDAIFELNPNSSDMIYSGDILRIPNGNTTARSQSNSNYNNSDYIDYEVKRGDTKSGLSKRFGVTIAMLEEQNPHTINMLQAGHILKIDKTLQTKPRASNPNEHFVVKGETLWGISKQYGINLNALIAANSYQLSEFLQIGQTLIIPDTNTINETLTTGEYIVKRGDTKFGLAKRFNMTIAELEEKNPQIISMLMAGHRINVSNNMASIADNDITNADKSNENIAKPNPKVNSGDEAYVDYIIQPKETLYSLSKKTNLTIGQLYNLNPKLLTAFNKGDTIKIPSASKQMVRGSNMTKTDIAVGSNSSTSEENKSLISNLNLSEKNGIYFYLPFSEREFKSRSLRLESANDNLQNYFEFYEGAQMAIDSAKALNLKFDATLIKKKDETDSKFEIKVDNGNTENAVLVPFLEKNMRFPEIVSKKNVPIVDIQSNIGTYPNTTVYRSMPSEQFQKTKTLNYLARQENSNVVVVSPLEKAVNKDLILKTIPDAQFLKVDKAGFFEEDELISALVKDQLNYIILDSEQTIIFLNTSTTLMGLLSKYNIQMVLINPELLTKQNEVSSMRYKILKLIYPTIALKEDLKDLKDFERKYEHLYASKPSKSAIVGFDVTLDVLLRLSQNATFENSIDTILNSEQTQLKFNYQKTNNSSYSNIGVYLMQYDANEGVIRIE